MARAKPSQAPPRIKRSLYRIFAIAVAVAVWYLFALGPGKSSEFPTPLDLLHAGIDIVPTGDYWTNIGASIRTAITGLVLCIVIGLPIGLAIGSHEYVRRSTQLVLDFGRTVPAIALLPLLLLVFGAGRTLGVVLILVSAIWPIVIQTSYAVGQISPQLKVVGRAYHLSRWHRLRYIVAPSMFPFVFAGLRIAATISLLMAISSEFLGGSNGLGYVLLKAMQISDTDRAIFYSFSAAILGLLLNLFFVLLQRRVLWWHSSVRQGGAS